MRDRKTRIIQKIHETASSQKMRNEKEEKSREWKKEKEKSVEGK